MPNKRIPESKRALILTALCEGMGVNSASRMFGSCKEAIFRLLKETAEACEDWHNREFRDLTIANLEVDEQWSYVFIHRDRMSREERRANPERGDAWLWLGLDPVSKATIAWRTGKRTAVAAQAFADDLASRVVGEVQVTTDPLASYNLAIPVAFGSRLHWATETKVFEKDKAPGHEWVKYRVNPLVTVERKAVVGKPNLRKATVSHTERLFLTVRQQNKRCARKTLAYSKRWDHHAAMISVLLFVYNWVRRHESTKQTPAQVLGVADKRWTMEDVVRMTGQHLKAKDDAAFEKAFESKFGPAPLPRRTYEPTPKEQLKTPWYLDPDSGGPNPEVRKEGIAYADELLDGQ